MDITSLQAKVEADKQAVTEAQSALDSANTTLATDEAELAQATTINAIEALTDISAVNSALEADNSKWRLVDTTPVVTEPSPAPEQPADTQPSA